MYLEVSARKGHSLSNGHVVNVARRAGAVMVLDSDAHEPGDLLTPDLAENVVLGAGLDSDEAHAVLELNPNLLLAKLGFAPVTVTVANL